MRGRRLAAFSLMMLTACASVLGVDFDDPATLPSGGGSLGDGGADGPASAGSGNPGDPAGPDGQTGAPRDGSLGDEAGGPCAGGACRFAFVTSTLYPGNLGGLLKADQDCAAAAAKSEVLVRYSFRAWLSGGGTAAGARFLRDDRPIVKLLTGTRVITVAASWDAFVAGALGSAIDVTENGAPPHDAAWTGSSADGATILGNCSTWESQTGSGRIGTVGQLDGTWSSASDLPCGSAAALYCIQQ